MSEISAGVPINEPTAPAVIPEKNKYLACKTNYSQTLLYGCPHNMNTSLLRTVALSLGKGVPLNLIHTLSMAPLVSVLIGFDCMSNILVDN